jgi:hypothetical protein
MGAAGQDLHGLLSNVGRTNQFEPSNLSTFVGATDRNTLESDAGHVKIIHFKISEPKYAPQWPIGDYFLLLLGIQRYSFSPCLAVSANTGFL